MKKTTLLLVLTLTLLNLNAQENKKYRIVCIGFYNVENLFDIYHDEGKNDYEFLPDGSNQWTEERYRKKLENISEVISKLGVKTVPGGAAIVGLSEIENRRVLDDLVAMPLIKDRNYQIVHYEGPDARGVDVALIYQPSIFKLVSSRSVRLTVPRNEGFFTRDQLLVSGIIDNEMIHIIVNHWPSRSSGEKRTSPLRCAAADLTRSIADSIMQTSPDAKIIVMGDLNDEPVNESILKHLRAKGKRENLAKGEMFNPMYKMYKDGVGSLAYRDAWSLFDNIIVSQSLLGDDKSTFKFYQAKVFNDSFLVQQSGAFKGYPWRTYAGGAYQGGYADHFPVYIYMIKEAK
ncbi:MAG: endonuclease/exonuclease/phosphatase family protein [Prevotellaceae bacterium]|jgi:predicted extracellular nuclease|nr:endonuclease/exonuclease/phosphatase family protein [Prevotellaceae bacterium]